MLLARQNDGCFAVPPIGALPRPLYVRAFLIPKRSTVELHTHPWPQFMYAVSGAMEVRTPIGGIPIPAGHAVWIPPEMPHGIATASEVAFHSLYVDGAAVRRTGGALSFVMVPPLLRELVHATRDIPVRYDPKSPDGRLVRVLLDQLGRLGGEVGGIALPTDKRLGPIVRTLLANPGDQRSLDEWGEISGTTRRTLSRLFRKETYLSFTDWRREARLRAALTMLNAGEPVTMVAIEVGYDSVSAFIAAFKRRFRTTPGDTRNAVSDYPARQSARNNRSAIRKYGTRKNRNTTFKLFDQ